jgi:alkanesulfonate monooxygenase SsuD/methylene tetrahydromethanopterin reductase-like flavin-dependent oxidoreductase (luciferase family)
VRCAAGADGDMSLRVGISPFGTTREGALRVADAAAAGGIDTLWVGDGLLDVPDFPQWSGGLEAFTELAWLAGRHPHVRVGVGAAVIPLRDPLWTVRQAATLAHLAGGGVVLGLCPGFWEREFTFRGLDYAERGRRFDELVDAVLALLAGRDHAGEAVVIPASGRVSPIPPPDRVEVWLAGGRPTFERALARQLPFQASRRSPEQLAPLAREWFERGGTTLALRVRVTVEPAGAATPGETVEWSSVTGGVDEVAAALHAYAGLGVTDLSIVPGQDDHTSLATVSALVEDVLPTFAS